MSEIGASLLQLAGNQTNEINSFIWRNIAIGYKTYNFNLNNELNINNPPIFDKINPECLILSVNNDNEYNLIFFQTYITPLTLNFTINNQNILKIPMALLWNLKNPEIINNKLYLKIPFDMFFGDINLCGLQNYEIKFAIDYSNIHLAGNNNMNIYHAQQMSFSLLCRTYSIDQRNLNFYADVSNNSIQQISSIQINTINNINSDEFRIRTNRFRGFIKGFFIESTHVFEYLQEIKFYTNQFIRFHYDTYLIREKCVKISNDMIYFPFNSQELFENNTNNSYIGSINFDGIESHFLNLRFIHRRQKVRIYALSKNNYNQRDGIFNIQTMYTNFNLYENFDTHPLTPIDDLINPFIQENLIQNHQNLLYSGPIYDASLNDVPYISQVLNRKIGEYDQNTCPIQQTEIQENERYMLCSSCRNCYNEYAIISWFVSCNNYNRGTTCPTCRSVWDDHNVYINAENEIPDENEIVQGNISTL
jgi:hypothetical protein